MKPEIYSSFFEKNRVASIADKVSDDLPHPNFISKLRTVHNKYFSASNISVKDIYRHIIQLHISRLGIQHSNKFTTSKWDKVEILPQTDDNVETTQRQFQDRVNKLNKEYESQFQFLDEATKNLENELEIEKLKTIKKMEEVDKMKNF